MGALIAPLAGVIGKVLDRVLPDKAANDAAKNQLAQLMVSGELTEITGQLDVDKAEAASQSTFVAGWRPFIGWICGLSLGTNYVFRPIFIWACNLAHRPADFPALDAGTLMPLVMAMLGMTAAHAWQDTTNQKTKAGNGA